MAWVQLSQADSASRASAGGLDQHTELDEIACFAGLTFFTKVKDNKAADELWEGLILLDQFACNVHAMKIVSAQMV